MWWLILAAHQTSGSNPASPTMILMCFMIIVYSFRDEKLRVESETYPWGKYVIALRKHKRKKKDCWILYISFLFTRPECSEYIIILYTIVNKQSVRDFSHIVFLWLKHCIPQCLCYKFYCMEDDLSGYFTANWKNWEKKKILESGLGMKYCRDCSRASLFL